jgi:uncharacterized protein
MSDRDGYAPGTPSWVDLTTPNPEGARRFYHELFGWEHTEPGPIEETGGYAMFICGGKLVAGVGPVMQEGEPTFWSTYFDTDDVDALAARVKEHGGSALMDPMDVMEAGRMGLFQHPAAGFFGAWQAGEHKGAQMVNEPVSLAWNALMTRDVEGASAFMHDVFGLKADVQDWGHGAYTVLMNGDESVAGISTMPGGVPDEAPNFWSVSFAVSDTDAVVSHVQELGGTVQMEAMDMHGVGRIAGLADPYGASFSVVQLAR